jgi:hypothetical protein
VFSSGEIGLFYEAEEGKLEGCCALVVHGFETAKVWKFAEEGLVTRFSAKHVLEEHGGGEEHDDTPFWF